MTRFIVVERETGHIYGDTARFGATRTIKSPADAVCLIDRHVGRAARGFGYVPAKSAAAQYDVYEVRRPETDRAAVSDDKAQALVREHGTLVASLIGYNS